MSMALDPKVRHSLATGDWVGAMAHGSYHTPFIGNGRNAWDAWQMGKPWSAAGHAGLFGVEALGMRSAGKVFGAGKVAKLKTRQGRIGKKGGAVGSGRQIKPVNNALQQALPSTEAFFNSADTVWKNGAQGSLSVAGRALQKHAGRAESAFSSIKFSGKTANQDAMKLIKEIMRAPNKRVVPQPNGTTVIYNLSSGRGFNISRKGLFNGFRNMKKE
jgi:hypothetical protein